MRIGFITGLYSEFICIIQNFPEKFNINRNKKVSIYVVGKGRIEEYYENVNREKGG